MSTWALLAPGPSITEELANSVRHLPTGAVGNAFQFAPWASFIAASDGGWWRKHPEARESDCKRFCMGEAYDTTLVRLSWSGNHVNSGVLALECAKREGATRILLAAGFDMHGTHFFGPYTNGLRNTLPHQRRVHLDEYRKWHSLNRKEVQVINCTPGSAIDCFPRADLEACLAELAARAA